MMRDLAAARLQSSQRVAAFMPLLVELNDLKRIRVADRQWSLATRLFRRAWKRLVDGQSLAHVAAHITAHAVASARLAGINSEVMAAAHMSYADTLAVLQRGFDAVATPLDQTQKEQLRSVLSADPIVDPAGTALPPFVDLLAAQPRAGATRPNHPRVMLEPPENHADHCATVAVYAVLLAPLFDANPALPFLTGLAHHLHNARLPDAGYAGDELVGEHLAPMMTAFREQAIAELPPAFQPHVREALTLVYQADSPEARAFQAADVLDRVLEMRWHAQSAAFTLDVALGEMDIVHPGPVQAFQIELLRNAGIM